MSWLAVDDGFAEHEKIIDLSDRSFRLHMAALCYCARNLTDGILRERQVAAVCAITKATRRHLLELVSAGLWEDLGDSFAINDYLDYNPTAAAVKERKRKRSEAGKRGADRRWHGKGDGKSHSNGHSESHMPPPLPSPTSSRALDVAAVIQRSLEEVA
jgi:hypothetical protein